MILHLFQESNTHKLQAEGIYLLAYLETSI